MNLKKADQISSMRIKHICVLIFYLSSFKVYSKQSVHDSMLFDVIPIYAYINARQCTHKILRKLNVLSPYSVGGM